MTRPSLVSTGAVPSFRTNTKSTPSPMNTKSANPADSKRCATNGGDYVTEGMAAPQQSTSGALTPVL